MKTSFEFVLDRRVVSVECGPRSGLLPTTTVLQYLRRLPQHKGAKEGCAEGDCGACTVVLAELIDGRLRYRAVDSCLLLLPMLHGKQLITVENLKARSGGLHPVQEAMIDGYGSQCGFCTPGMVMSLFALYENETEPTESTVRSALTGNLCRCTGYKPIINAAVEACKRKKEKSPEDSAHIVEMLGTISAASFMLTSEGQSWFRPGSVGEALRFRREHHDAIVINGATDVALRVSKYHERLPSILDLSGVTEFRSWSAGNGTIRIGAGTTIEEFLQICGDRFPAFADALRLFGGLQIRNLATIAGNIGTASPVGDLLPLLIAHRAMVILRSGKGEREIPAAAFVTGYRRTATAVDELIVAIKLPEERSNALIRSYKVSKRRDLDIATVSGGFRIELGTGNRVDDVVLAYGGMAEKVKRAEKAEAFLRGKKWDRNTVEEAMKVVDGDFTPISDVRGSAAMRRIVARNLLLKFWSETSGNGGAAWD